MSCPSKGFNEGVVCFYGSQRECRVLSSGDEKEFGWLSREKKMDYGVGVGDERL